MEKKERKIILFSLFAGLVLLFIEIAMSIETNSQAMLMDALYDSIDIIIVALTLFLINLYHKPISEKKPFGFSQLESFFILLKTFMILALNVSIIINAVVLIVNGGREVDVTTISVFQFVLFIGNLVTWIMIRHFNKKINSPTIKAEVLSWKADVFYSIGLAFAFFMVQFLKGTKFNNLVLYFDQIVVIISGIIMLPDLLKVLKENITSVLLFAPSDELVSKIKSIVEKSLENMDAEILHYDIIKTGRKIWISIYFKTMNDILDDKQLKQKTLECSEKLNKQIGNVYFELVPDVENYYN